MRSAAIALALLAATAQAFPAKLVSRGQSHSKPSGEDNTVYSGNGPTDDVRSKALDAHNTAREHCGAPALAWDENLARGAQSYADEMDCTMEHSDGPYGENLATNSDPDVHKMVVEQWLDEAKDYDSPGFSEAAGHYTQAVWKGSERLGCGLSKCGLLVCRYEPAGNVEGEYEDNVPSPGSFSDFDSLPYGGKGESPIPKVPGYGGGDKSPMPKIPVPVYGGQKPKPKPEQPCDDDKKDQKPVFHPVYKVHKEDAKPIFKPVYKDESPEKRPKPFFKDESPEKRPKPRPRPEEPCEDDKKPKPFGKHDHHDQDADRKPKWGHDDDDHKPRWGHGDDDQKPRRGGRDHDDKDEPCEEEKGGKKGSSYD